MKKIFYIFVFFTGTLILTQSANADYTLANGSATEPAWVVYSAWRGADRNWPEGFHTQGWYKIEPGGIKTLPVPEDNRWVYIRVERGGVEIKPPNQIKRGAFLFWIHPSEAFRTVATENGEFLGGNFNKLNLEQAELYEFRNGGQHTITDASDHNLPDLPAQQIYDHAINSVVWILTDDGMGSGVLIDKERRLAVTNAHVTNNAESVGVIFPYRNRNGELIKDENFYLGNNLRWLYDNGYATFGSVIAEEVGIDLAIIQLDQLPLTSLEIPHGFGGRIEARMKRGDKVHIMGNPGGRLWNWTQGSFIRDSGKWLELEGDGEGGLSGGPVLNGQGTLIGIIAQGTDETLLLAVPSRDIGALLNTRGIVLPVQLSNFSPKRDALTGTVTIKWITESELNNAGFNILRGETKTGEFKVINTTMILGAGTTGERQGYSYVDTTAKANVSYYYKIEDISFDGKHRTLVSAIRLRGDVVPAHKVTMTWGKLKSQY